MLASLRVCAICIRVCVCVCCVHQAFPSSPTTCATTSKNPTSTRLCDVTSSCLFALFFLHIPPSGFSANPTWCRRLFGSAVSVAFRGRASRFISVGQTGAHTHRHSPARITPTRPHKHLPSSGSAGQKGRHHIPSHSSHPQFRGACGGSSAPISYACQSITPG